MSRNFLRQYSQTVNTAKKPLDDLKPPKGRINNTITLRSKTTGWVFADVKENAGNVILFIEPQRWRFGRHVFAVLCSAVFTSFYSL